ncbi:MAG: isopentenyl phosphate kinase [Candidatus Hydrothermarchaeales archaeon]
MIILKLGGSLITDKKRRFSVRGEVLKRVAAEIREAGVTAEGGLIIIHGGGSFGHPLAKEYKLQKGSKVEEQIQGVALTRKAMGELNNCVVSALVEQDIPAVVIQSSAVVVCRDGRIHEFNLEALKGFLTLGLVPVLYGDVVLDEEQGFCILSGDQIVSYLSRIFKPDKIVLATDVDGVFDKDPKKSKNAKLLKELANRDLHAIDFGLEEDATGGIRGKLLELLELAEEGFQSHIINALKEDRMKKALLGKEVIGTKIRSNTR